MNSEQIEHKLMQIINSKRVDVVRPFFGTQSDSWSGTLRLDGAIDVYPIYFYFYPMAGGSSIRFTAEDVLRIDDPPQHAKFSDGTIRLKGPQHYSSQFVTA